MPLSRVSRLLVFVRLVALEGRDPLPDPKVGRWRSADENPQQQEEASMIRKIVPDVINNQTLVWVGPGDTVRHAAQLMRELKVAAVLVMEGQRLVGIVTERDMTARVVAFARSPDTKCGEIMTVNPDTLSPNDTAADAIAMMRSRGYRHLPVVEGDHVVGMVSVRDLYAVHNTELAEDLRDHESFIYGERYGTA
jgi:signal-transduction protein with cAMP-binding, CBS, and nucleotidyltransferase domain